MVVPVGLIARSINSFANSSASDKRKSFVLSVLLYAVLLLILFFIRFWPPSNIAELSGGGGGGGMTVNFGDTDAGMGNNFENPEKVVETVVKPIPVKETPQEQDVIAEENSKEDGVVIPKKVNIKKIKEVIIKETKPVIKTPVAVKPKVSSTTNDALSSIIKGSKSGDGNTKTQGNQGSGNGSLSSGGYSVGGSGGGTGGGNGNGNGSGSGNGTGSGTGGGNGSGNGMGSGAGYALGNRKALNKPAPKYTCNEEGKVVVEVTVDKNGTTITATAGIKGTTNTAKCLLDQARIAAMNTKWQASSDAPDSQVGKIVYNFSLN
jgi:outer membrane biosynthesis protein TonB